MHWHRCTNKHRRKYKKKKKKKTRTEALAQGPSKPCWSEGKETYNTWSGVCAESSVDPPGNTNTTTSMRDPRTGGQQKTAPTAQAYQCEQTACTGAGHKQTQENAQKSRPLTDALAQAPSKNRAGTEESRHRRVHGHVCIQIPQTLQGTQTLQQTGSTHAPGDNRRPPTALAQLQE